MTDDNPVNVDALAARLDQIVSTLERLGLSLPEPGGLAAVGPDGYPAHVVSGELVESAWGNAVVDKLRGVGRIAGGQVFSGPSTGNDYLIQFPFAFPTIPNIVVMNGDVGAGQFAIHRVASLCTTSTAYVRCFYEDAAQTPVGAVIRLMWLAWAALPAATATPADDDGEPDTGPVLAWPDEER